MLEDPTFPVSRDVQNSCEQENQWIYNTFRVMEFSNNKCQLEVEEENQLLSRKSYKLSDDPEEEEARKSLIFLYHTRDQISEQNDAGDTDFLIDQLGRDMTISCLLRCSRSDYGSIASLNRSFRSLIRSGEIYKLRRQMGIVEHWVYFSYSVFEWKAFDPNRGRWITLPRLPSDDCFVCSDKESLAVGTELLVFGREIMSQIVFRYSLLTHKWSYGTEMNTPRNLFGSASLGEIAIFAGGSDAEGKILDVAELYNSDTRTWETLPRMNKARRMCSGAFMDGKFYVIGGMGTGEEKHLTCGEEFDLNTRKWREIPNMFPPSEEREQNLLRLGTPEAPPLVAVVNNVLYAADYARREVRRYVKDSNSWVGVGRLPERAESTSGWGIGFRACGDKLIVIGGEKHSYSNLLEINAWAPDNGGEPQWNLLSSSETGSFVYNCAVMGC